VLLIRQIQVSRQNSDAIVSLEASTTHGYGHVQRVREKLVVHDSVDALVLDDEEKTSIHVFLIIVVAQMSFRIVPVLDELDKSERLNI
jgi:hypothetical protein